MYIFSGKRELQDVSLPTEKYTGEEKKTFITKRKIIKNLLIVCFGLVLLFIAYNGLSMLQSTLNQKQGIGVASQAIIYAGFCISALLLPKYTIKKLGCKHTLLLSMSFYIPYIAANFYFTWLTMIPSAILVGLSASLLWSSQSTYFNESSVIYSKLCFNEIQEKKPLSKNFELSNCNKNDQNKSGEVTQDNNEKLNILSIKDLQNANSKAVNGDWVTHTEICVQTVQDKNNETKIHVETNCCVLDKNLKDCNVKDRRVLPEIASHSEDYSKIVSSVTARFFGLFGLIFRSSDIWSNLISYYVLNDNTVLDNVTENSTCGCGASFCNEESECFSHNLAEPTQEMRNLLSGGSVLLACFAVLLIFLFLDELERDKEPVEFSFSLAMATCKFARRKEALLLLPLSSYIGFQQGFYIGDFTKVSNLKCIIYIYIYLYAK